MLLAKAIMCVIFANDLLGVGVVKSLCVAERTSVGGLPQIVKLACQSRDIITKRDGGYRGRFIR